MAVQKRWWLVARPKSDYPLRIPSCMTVELDDAHHDYSCTWCFLALSFIVSNTSTI